MPSSSAVIRDTARSIRASPPSRSAKPAARSTSSTTKIEDALIRHARGSGFCDDIGGFSIYRRAIEQFDVGRAAAETIVNGLVIGLATLPVVRLHQHFERRE